MVSVQCYCNSFPFGISVKKFYSYCFLIFLCCCFVCKMWVEKIITYESIDAFIDTFINAFIDTFINPSQFIHHNLFHLFVSFPVMPNTCMLRKQHNYNIIIEKEKTIISNFQLEKVPLTFNLQLDIQICCPSSVSPRTYILSLISVLQGLYFASRVCCFCAIHPGWVIIWG